LDLYIYYRVLPSNAAALQARVAAMQQSLAGGAPGMTTALKRRPEEKDGRQTWMEIYQDVPVNFDAMLEQAVARADLAALTEGPRHTEIFVDVIPCA
jgi:Domain of unknown function (DUF4936)